MPGFFQWEKTAEDAHKKAGSRPGPGNRRAGLPRGMLAEENLALEVQDEGQAVRRSVARNPNDQHVVQSGIIGSRTELADVA